MAATGCKVVSMRRNNHGDPFYMELLQPNNLKFFIYSTTQIQLHARVVRQCVLLSTQTHALFECTRVEETHIVLHTRGKQ